MSKKVRFFLSATALSFLLVWVLFSVSSVSAIPASLNVNASPPYLSKPIPNQSWAVNTNLTNAFNLNNYFIDPLGENMSYSFSLSDPSAVTITISSNGSVSFFAKPGYVGTVVAYFNATAGNLTGESNPVYLKIGLDTQPPKWFSPGMNPAKVYQNSFVNFTTLWTDNVALAKFVFSIFQGGTWQNYTGHFSGVSNNSVESIEISASAGSIVSWYFCGYDTSNNVNCTKMQNFTVSTQPVSPPITTTPNSTITGNQTYQNQTVNQSTPKTPNNPSYNLNPLIFKISLKQGSSQTRVLKITNTGNVNLTFVLSTGTLSNMMTLSSQEFSLDSGQSKSITVDFTAGKYTSPGEYFGGININSSSMNSTTLPVIIDVNPYVLDFTVNVSIPSQYSNVDPGRPVGANISIINIKDEPTSNITLYYAIKDLSGNVYNYSEENLTLTNKLAIQRFLTVPSDALAGTYLFYAKASLGNFTTIDSATFEVGTAFNFDAIFRYGSIISAIFLLSAVSMSLFFKYRREHEKDRLLNLYMMLTELKKLIKDGDTESALNLFIRIKSAYGEKVSESAFDNKEKLKEEINALSARLQKEVDLGGVTTGAADKEASADNDKKSGDNQKATESGEGKEEEGTEKADAKKGEGKKEEAAKSDSSEKASEGGDQKTPTQEDKGPEKDARSDSSAQAASAPEKTVTDQKPKTTSKTKGVKKKAPKKSKAKSSGKKVKKKGKKK